MAHLHGTIRTFLSILDSREKSILKRSYAEKSVPEQNYFFFFFGNFSMNFERKTITFVLAIITPSGNVKESDTFKMFLFLAERKKMHSKCTYKIGNKFSYSQYL